MATLAAGVAPTLAPLSAPQPQAALSPRVVTALDAARALSAVYVVLHHLATARGWLGGVGVVLRFGQEAVIVFFLLSGFVIYAAERTRALRPGPYILRRLRRIYPLLIAALLVSTLVALDDGDLARRFDLRSLVGTLTGLQDVAALKPGVIVDPYLDNFPLWSLSYELAFYLIFPLVLAAAARMPRATDHLVGAACCGLYLLYAVQPGHLALVGAYFLVWWAGAAAARAYLAGGRSVRAIGPVLGWLALLTALAAGVLAVEGWQSIGTYPALPVRHFAVAGVLLVATFGPVGRIGVAATSRLGGPAAFVASISYALYVFHYPLLVQWDRARDGPGCVAAAGVLVGLAVLAERHGPFAARRRTINVRLKEPGECAAPS